MKGHAESKILVGVLIITLLVIGAIIWNRPGFKSKNQPDLIPTVIVEEAEEQADTVLDEEVEEGMILELTAPAHGSTVSASEVAVTGTTEANAEVFINEKELRADAAGNFSSMLTLEEGDNIIVVTVSDDEGNYSEKTLTVTYEPTETF